MAFDIKALFRVADLGAGRSLWSYTTADAHASVDTAGYFTGEALNVLKIGDIIEVFVGTLGTDYALTAISTYGRHMVKDVVAGTSVDTTDVTVGTMTDTD